jgi:NAD(P)H dehydrogenase (quinone)
MSTPRTLLVTGASGKLGRRTVEILAARHGGDHVIAGSRNPDRLAIPGVEGRVVDFDRPDTLKAAFAGVDRLLIVSSDALDRPGHRLEQNRAAIDAALHAGVKHIVYTSFINAVPTSAAAYIAADHAGTEAYLSASAPSHTILRNSLYMENLLGALPHAVATGTWYTAVNANGRTSYIAREDCAQAAAAALAGDFSGRRQVTLTGPEALTPADIAGRVSRVTGRPLTAVTISIADEIAGLTKAGFPPAVADIFSTFSVATNAGEYAVVNSAVQDLTGHAPVTFDAFLATNRQALTG